MDANEVIQGLLAAFGAVLWYLYRDVKAKVEVTEKALLEYKAYCAEKYVTDDQLSKAMESLNKTIETVADGVLRIETRLNHMVDNGKLN